MKKILAMALVAAMSFSLLSGCGSKTEAPAADATAEETTEETTEAEDVAATEGPAPDWAAYDELISQIKTSTDLVEREALMHQAEDILMATNAIMIFTCRNPTYQEFMQMFLVSNTFSSQQHQEKHLT